LALLSPHVYPSNVTVVLKVPYVRVAPILLSYQATKLDELELARVIEVVVSVK
jgi:hypothetical protein